MRRKRGTGETDEVNSARVTGATGGAQRTAAVAAELRPQKGYARVRRWAARKMEGVRDGIETDGSCGGGKREQRGAAMGAKKKLATNLSSCHLLK